ncbi:transposase [Xanthomonas campestris]|uniref:transposase n=1 Tax=Xanthomonas campestris TaxID=339 RepID=UPI002ED5FCA9|nr:transposase [Xanthomonas campestris pv. barbareae]
MYSFTLSRTSKPRVYGSTCLYTANSGQVYSLPKFQATASAFGRVPSLSAPTPFRESCQVARLPRIDLPGIPQHIVQRGNNRLPCFLDDGDRLRYLHLLHEALHATGCQLHAYVLMDNHVHLLVTPPAAATSPRF